MQPSVLAIFILSLTEIIQGSPIKLAKKSVEASSNRQMLGKKAVQEIISLHPIDSFEKRHDNTHRSSDRYSTTTGRYRPSSSSTVIKNNGSDGTEISNNGSGSKTAISSSSVKEISEGLHPDRCFSFKGRKTCGFDFHFTQTTAAVPGYEAIANRQQRNETNISDDESISFLMSRDSREQDVPAYANLFIAPILVLIILLLGCIIIDLAKSR